MKHGRIIVGITGASGPIYGLKLLEALHEVGSIEIHLIVSSMGQSIMQQEIGQDALERAMGIAHHTYNSADLTAPIASGSFITEGMIIAPCSAKTLSCIANAYGNNLITRAADVTLKERRKLVLLFRETPLNLAHIENMAQVTRMGGIILPPIPAFYHKPANLDDVIKHTIGKALDLFGLDHDLYTRWAGQVSD